MKSNRRLLEDLHGHRYERWRPLDGYRGCFYCGDTEAALIHDHVPALVNAELYVDAKGHTRLPFLLIKACSACNVMLYHTAPDRLLERAQYAAKRLERLYERAYPPWTEEELAGMSAEFTRTIRARTRLSAHLLNRVRHAQWRCLQYESFPVED